MCFVSIAMSLSYARTNFTNFDGILVKIGNKVKHSFLLYTRRPPTHTNLHIMFNRPIQYYSNFSNFLQPTSESCRLVCRRFYVGPALIVPSGKEMLNTLLQPALFRGLSKKKTIIKVLQIKLRTCLKIMYIHGVWKQTIIYIVLATHR